MLSPGDRFGGGTLNYCDGGRYSGARPGESAPTGRGGSGAGPASTSASTQASFGIDAEFTTFGGPTPLGFPRGTKYWEPNKAGFTGGGQIGYNLQSGNFVYGVEADFNYVSNKASVTQATAILFVPSLTSTTKLDWMGTVRGRLGVALSPTLIYVTGGWAFAHFEDTVYRPRHNHPRERQQDIFGMDCRRRRRAYVRPQLDGEDRGALRRLWQVERFR